MQHGCSLKALLAVFAAVVFTAAFPRVALASEPPASPRSDVATDTVLVMLDDTPGSIPAASVRSAGAAETGTGWVAIPTRRGESVDDAIERLDLTPGVAEVTYNYLYEPASIPNDPDYDRQWHLGHIGVGEAWESTTGQGVTVAVLDSGVGTGGDDLTCHTFAHPYNAFTREPGLDEAADDSGHGTHVTGTISQCTNNGIGGAGVAPGATIMPVKVLAGGIGTSSSVAEGIHWAVDHGADVINMSLGRPCFNDWPICKDLVIDAAIDYATENNVVVVAAAGNNDFGWVSSPANHPDAIAVGASTSRDERAGYSNHGDGLDLLAPGGTGTDLNQDGHPDGVLQETFWGGHYASRYLTGTSMATPHVSGAAALILSLLPGRSPAEVRSLLTSTATDVGAAGWDRESGAGVLRIDAAVAAALPTTLENGPVTILGGSGAVKDSVRSAVSTRLHSSVDRLHGPNRYATAAAISAEFYSPEVDTVYVTTGTNFPDALSVGPVAGARGAPVLLVNSGVPGPTRNELIRLQPAEIVVIGGPSVISEAVVDELEHLGVAPVERVSGFNRYATAVEVSRSHFTPGTPVVYLTTGRSFPDALAAGAAASAESGPLLLSEADVLPGVVAAEILRLAPERLVIVGGDGSVGPAVADAIAQLGIAVVTRISGPDRYSTSAAVSAAVFDPGVGTVFLATGEKYPDALAGIAAAGAMGAPVLLVSPEELPSAISTELVRLAG
jgi:subtilisin family serine protease